jgi:hypothetical protein
MIGPLNLCAGDFCLADFLGEFGWIARVSQWSVEGKLTVRFDVMHKVSPLRTIYPRRLYVAHCRIPQGKSESDQRPVGLFQSIEVVPKIIDYIQKVGVRDI